MSIYQSIYNIINEYIFGGAIEQGSTQALVTELFATSASMLAVALPFVVIIVMLKVISRI